ncbi:hypothetical protein WJX73_003523 [Symbiochloris irregularis]|uniref:U1-type domain-containing protein n=1 Tax=Symbiochloris irregularis TaxID=706552 RepID=A0AAW1PWS6_9CHLO
MVWFECGDCGESVKKPKVDAHKGRCSSSHFTCLDCSRTFGRNDVKQHTSCVTEHDKYASGATKPGGFAATGFFNSTSQRPTEAGTPEGTQYLSKGPPWVCSICQVTCTSQQTLDGHASGAKHKRRARAASNAAVAEASKPAAAAAVAPATIRAGPPNAVGNELADKPTASLPQLCNGANGAAKTAAAIKISKAVRQRVDLAWTMEF